MSERKRGCAAYSTTRAGCTPPPLLSCMVATVVAEKDMRKEEDDGDEETERHRASDTTGTTRCRNGQPYPETVFGGCTNLRGVGPVEKQTYPLLWEKASGR